MGRDFWAVVALACLVVMGLLAILTDAALSSLSTV